MSEATAAAPTPLEALRLLALLATVGLTALTRIYWPSPRALTATGFFWAGVLSLACVHAGPRARSSALVLGGLLLFGWAGLRSRLRRGAAPHQPTRPAAAVSLDGELGIACF